MREDNSVDAAASPRPSTAEVLIVLRDVLTAAIPRYYRRAIEDAIAEIERGNQLRAALRPFVDAYKKSACPVGDSDLDNEQPRSVSVTLGDCRRAARVLR